MKQLRIAVFVAACLVAIGALASHPDDHNEWQYWNEFVAEGPVAPRVSLELALEQNWFDDASDFGMYNVQMRPAYELNDAWSLGVEYRCEREEDGDDWATEHRYGFLPVLRQRWADWRLKLTSRLEYRDKQNDDWRWREKLKVSKPCAFGGFEVTPWVAEELFYSFDAGEVNQSRVSAGVTKGLPGGIELTLYYVNRLDREGSSWTPTHVAGTEFAIAW